MAFAVKYTELYLNQQWNKNPVIGCAVHVQVQDLLVGFTIDWFGT